MPFPLLLFHMVAPRARWPSVLARGPSVVTDSRRRAATMRADGDACNLTLVQQQSESVIGRESWQEAMASTTASVFEAVESPFLRAGGLGRVALATELKRRKKKN